MKWLKLLMLKLLLSKIKRFRIKMLININIINCRCTCLFRNKKTYTNKSCQSLQHSTQRPTVRWGCRLRQGCQILTKVGQIGTKSEKSGSFSDQISVHLARWAARWAKCTEIWSEKVPDLSHLGPIWPILGPNLTSQ